MNECYRWAHGTGDRSVPPRRPSPATCPIAPLDQPDTLANAKPKAPATARHRGPTRTYCTMLHGDKTPAARRRHVQTSPSSRNPRWNTHPRPRTFQNRLTTDPSPTSVRACSIPSASRRRPQHVPSTYARLVRVVSLHRRTSCLLVCNLPLLSPLATWR